MEATYYIKVAFRKEEDGNILAVFPEEFHDKNRRHVMGYATVGMHCDMSMDYARELDIPSVDETIELRNELRSMGYILIDTKI